MYCLFAFATGSANKQPLVNSSINLYQNNQHLQLYVDGFTDPQALHHG